MKHLWFSILALVLVFNVADAKQTYFPASDNGKAQSTASGTFGASVVDTVIWTREPGVTAISFGIYVADTCDMSTTTAVRRIVKGVAVTALTADTLANAELILVSNAAEPGASLDAVTLAPLAEQYWFVLTYHSTNCGTGTSNPITYRLFKQYAK